MTEENAPSPNEPENDLIPEEEGGGEEGGIDKRIWPYRDERSIQKAVEQYLNRNTQPRPKRQILDRLLISRPLVLSVIPQLMDNFHVFDMGVRHILFDLLLTLVKEDKADLSPIADILAKYLADANFALRQKAAEILIAMGPQAQGGIARISGHLRHNLPDIRVSAARVLGAIGPVCARVALPKLDRQLRASRDEETKIAVTEAMEAIRSSGRGVVPPGEVDRERKRTSSRLPTESTVLNKYPNLSGKRILIVEDEAPVRRVLLTAFKSANCHIDEAENGRVALEKLIQESKAGTPFHAVLLDLMMPVMNGGEVLKVIRSLPNLKGTAVFVISARQERAIVEAIARLGIQGYFPKPYNIASVLDKMDRSFSG